MTKSRKNSLMAFAICFILIGLRVSLKHLKNLKNSL